jgi:hypothetical protein
MKSESKVKNGWCGILVSCLLILGSITFLRANPEEQIAVHEGAVDCRERQVVWAKKILSEALFKAINQGSRKGVQFLVKGGADPNEENKRGRTFLELAEFLAEKNPDEQERLAIVDFLCDWDSKRSATDDGTILATAKEINGLKGGGKVGLAKKAAEVVLKPIAKVLNSPVGAGAAAGAAKYKASRKSVKRKMVPWGE